MKKFIYGLGKSNQSLFKYFKQKEQGLAVYDSRGALWYDSIKGLLDGADIVQDLKEALNYRTWYVSPGIKEDDEWLQEAMRQGITLSNDIDLFSKVIQKPIVAITGTNGKSTVSAMIEHLAKDLEINVALGGNFGTPVFDLLKDADLYVLELSSFQLFYTKNLEAKVVVFTNFVPDHLDWHISLESYRQAKERIFIGAESAVVNGQDAVTWPQVEVQNLEKVMLQESDSRVESLQFLMGDHQKMNALMALTAGRFLGWDESRMLQSITTYQALPHRMQRVSEGGDVVFINDSKATNIASAKAAITSFENIQSTVWVLLGGRGKGQDFSLLKDAFTKENIQPICYGECGSEIANALGVSKVFSTMTDAMQEALKFASAGDTVLLSPACSSFDEFKNYEERGQCFEEFARMFTYPVNENIS